VLIPAPPAAVFVRFYGADGALLGVDGGQAGYITFDNETQIFGVTRRLGGTGFCDHETADGFALMSQCRRRDIAGAVVVPCSPRAALAYGRMPDRFAAPRVLLAGGEAVRSRRISLRGEDAWLAFLPDGRVRGLRSGKQHVGLDLPPASSQCGYSVARGF
jgi:hypothetical protein